MQDLRPLTKKEQKEHTRLQKKWMLRKATMREMRRCTDLDRQALAATKRAGRS